MTMRYGTGVFWRLFVAVAGRNYRRNDPVRVVPAVFAVVRFVSGGCGCKATQRLCYAVRRRTLEAASEPPPDSD